MLVISGYFFQLGGILGGAFRGSPVPFAAVYAAAPGGAEKLASWLQGDAARTVAHYADRVATINQFVYAYEMERREFSGDVGEYLLNAAAEKLKPEAVAELATIYGAFGAGFGMVYPDMFVGWYENNYQKRDEETWRMWRNAGLDIPAEQEDAPYAEAEHEALTMFREYTLEFFPKFAAPLGFA